MSTTVNDGKTATPVGYEDAAADDVMPVGDTSAEQGVWVLASKMLERLIRAAGVGDLVSVGDVPAPAGVVAVDPADGTAYRIAPNSLGGGGGGGGAVNYLHTQSSASDTWTVNHNLGYRPVVSVRSPGGVEVEATVTHVSVNQCVVTFAAPYTGSVFCSA